MGVPYTFSTASQSIPLAQLDANFATPIVLGSSTAALGQTVTTLNNLTLSNVTILSGSATLNNLTGNVTFGNTTVNLGSSSSSIGNLTLNNVQINNGNLSSAVIPTANGTVMLSGNMPTFGAYQNVAQSHPGLSTVKIQFQVKEWDVANAYDATTNYRFTPQVAGYYQVNAGIAFATNNQLSVGYIFKNGLNYKAGVQGISGITTVNSLVYLNGSTDYVEIFAYTGAAQNTAVGIVNTYFNSSLIRTG